MTNFEWFLLIVVVIVVPLIVAVVVTLWTIDQANKRKRANRKDPQIGVKRQAALSPEEAEARKTARAQRQAEADQAAIPDPAAGVVLPASSETDPVTVTSSTGKAVTINDLSSPAPFTAAALDESLADSAAIAPDLTAVADDTAAMEEEVSEEMADAGVEADSADERMP